MIRRIALSMLLFFTCGFPLNSYALATLTGLWWNPNESGWGVSLDHQSSFVFAAFYIYDETGKPFWIVGELSATSGVSPTFVGPVYNAVGTPFSRSPFVAADTKGTMLGTATLSVTDPGHATLSYTVNGIRIDKQIQRQTTKPIALAGSFDDGGSNTYSVTTFQTVAAVVSVRIVHTNFFDGTCQYEGTITPIGPRYALVGAYRCSNLIDGAWNTDDFMLHDDGATMSATIFRRSNGSVQPVSDRWMAMQSSGRTVIGPISLPTRPVASFSGLWWNPNESGWGVAFDQQSSFVFASFYIYDGNGKPFWVVSELNSSAAAPGIFTGPVYNATGTPFSRSPFVAADTKGVPLGSATLSLVDSNHANLSYSVNGTQVVKQIQRQTTKPLNLVGRYAGGFSPAIFGVDNRTYNITSDGAAFTLDLTAFAASPCKYIGTATYFGARTALSGTYRCGLIEGVWSTDDMTIVDGDLLIATIKRGPIGGTPVMAERWFARKVQ